MVALGKMTKPLKRVGLNDEGRGGNSSFGDLAGRLRRRVLGAVELVSVVGEDFFARIDSGAEKSSICISLVEKFNLGPAIEETSIRSTNGKELRKVIMIAIKLADCEIVEKFNVSDRKHMSYPILIGRNILERGFLIDVAR